MPNKPTKADIVSTICKIYNPMGLYGPTILHGKLIMQDFWKVKDLGWNDLAPEELVKRWQEFDSDIKLLNCHTIPRWLGYSAVEESEWHVFVDASELAYGAAIYLSNYQI